MPRRRRPYPFRGRWQPDATLHRQPQVGSHREGKQVPLDDPDHVGSDPLGMEPSHTSHPLWDNLAPREVFLVRIGYKVLEDRERTSRKCGAQVHPRWRDLRAPQTEGTGHVQPDTLTRPLVIPPIGSKVTIVPNAMIHYRVVIEHVRGLPRTHLDLVPNGKSLPPRQIYGPDQRTRRSTITTTYLPEYFRSLSLTYHEGDTSASGRMGSAIGTRPSSILPSPIEFYSSGLVINISIMAFPFRLILRSWTAFLKSWNFIKTYPTIGSSSQCISYMRDSLGASPSVYLRRTA